ncbi:hypothetical protein BH09GEM1_BH09GEM1_22270 [soil metagenome]
MRFYDIGISTLVIDAPRKWTDNILSQHTIPDVRSGRQGVARRISYPALIRLGIIRQLHTELGIGVADAIRLAAQLLDSGQETVLEAGQLRLRVDYDALRQLVDERLALALESAPSPKRGRPPRKASGF